MTSLIGSPFLQALGWVIAGSLWQMALLWVIYQLCFLAWRNARASVRTGAATVLLFTGFCWFISSTVRHYWELDSMGSGADVAGSSKAAYHFAPFIIHGHALIDYVNAALAWAEPYLPYLSSAYLLVLAFLLIRVGKAYRHVQAVRTEGLSKIDAHWRIYVQQMAARIGIHRKVKVWLSEKIDIPATVGYLKPLILLPIASFNQLTTEQVEAILLHELAHIKRNDYLLNLVITVVDTILFFNPFAQLIARHIRTERENSCDDFVLQFRYNPHSYASALLSLERERVSPELAMAASGKTDLLNRIKRILNVPSKPMNYGQKLMALLITAGILASLAWLTPENVEHKPLLNPMAVYFPGFGENLSPIVGLSPRLSSAERSSFASVTRPSRKTALESPAPPSPEPGVCLRKDKETDDLNLESGPAELKIFNGAGMGGYLDSTVTPEGFSGGAWSTGPEAEEAWSHADRAALGAWGDTCRIYFLDSLTNNFAAKWLKISKDSREKQTNPDLVLELMRKNGLAIDKSLQFQQFQTLRFKEGLELKQALLFKGAQIAQDRALLDSRRELDVTRRKLREIEELQTRELQRERSLKDHKVKAKAKGQVFEQQPGDEETGIVADQPAWQAPASPFGEQAHWVVLPVSYNPRAGLTSRTPMAATRAKTTTQVDCQNQAVAYAEYNKSMAAYKERITLYKTAGHTLTLTAVNDFLAKLEEDGVLPEGRSVRIIRNDKTLTINGKPLSKDESAHYQYFMGGKSLIIISTGKTVQVTVR
jgi:Zn-dependent protease with chaperone function